jgi:hypothetical protein
VKIGCAALYPITRYGFPYSFDNYLKAIAEMRSAGFGACELEINVDIDLTEYEGRIEEIREVLARNEMTLSAVIGVRVYQVPRLTGEARPCKYGCPRDSIGRPFGRTL